MPHYEIHISRTSYSKKQAHELAQRITKLHCSTFGAPSIFVRVSIHGLAKDRVDYDFTGGEETEINYIVAHLRPRPSKAPDTLAKLIQGITQIWEDVMHVDAVQLSEPLYKRKEPLGRLDDPRALHNVFILEDIAAGAEQGLLLPVAGKDPEWAEDNMVEFRRRADLGDKSMLALIREIKRGLGSGPLERSKTSKL